MVYPDIKGRIDYKRGNQVGCQPIVGSSQESTKPEKPAMEIWFHVPVKNAVGEPSIFFQRNGCWLLNDLSR